MSRAIQPIVYIVLAWLMVATLAGCVLAPPREVPPQTGRVLDEETQQPIEGAIVVLRWQGVGTKAFVDTQTVCYHVESAVTDDQGRYVTMPWTEESRYLDLSMKSILVSAYKAGYRQVRMGEGTSALYLKRDKRQAKERLGYLLAWSSYVSCGSSDDQPAKLLRLYDSMYQEAARISGNSIEERKIVNSLHYSRDVFQYGWDAAQKRRESGMYE